jgi:hypothetical protein
VEDSIEVECADVVMAITKASAFVDVVLISIESAVEEVISLVEEAEPDED